MNFLLRVPPINIVHHVITDPQGFVRGAKKFLIALLAALGVFASQLQAGPITTAGWIQIALSFLGALGVYQISNS